MGGGGLRIGEVVEEKRVRIYKDIRNEGEEEKDYNVEDVEEKEDEHERKKMQNGRKKKRRTKMTKMKIQKEKGRTEIK